MLLTTSIIVSTLLLAGIEREDAVEVGRIRAQLEAVERVLREAEPPVRAHGAVVARAALLDALAQYREAGLFPHNHVTEGQSPVFIDEHGTACAVGALMIASGHEALARAIAAKDNLVRLPVRDVAIERWAHNHGFTIDELARIQPTYGSPLHWAHLARAAEKGDVERLLASGHRWSIGELSLAAMSAARAGRIDAVRLLGERGAKFNERRLAQLEAQCAAGGALVDEILRLAGPSPDAYEGMRFGNKDVWPDLPPLAAELAGPRVTVRMMACAALSGDQARVQRLALAGGKLDGAVAGAVEHPALLEWLLDQPGASANATRPCGHQRSGGGCAATREIASARRAADARDVGQAYDEGVPALHRAILARRIDAVDALLASGADPNLRTLSEGYAPAELAAFVGDDETLAKLAARGAHLDAVHPKGFTLRDFAMFGKNPLSSERLDALK